MLPDAVDLGLLFKNKFCLEKGAHSASSRSSDFCQLNREVSGIRNNDSTILTRDRIFTKCSHILYVENSGVSNIFSEQSIYLIEIKQVLNNINDLETKIYLIKILIFFNNFQEAIIHHKSIGCNRTVGCKGL